MKTPEEFKNELITIVEKECPGFDLAECIAYEIGDIGNNDNKIYNKYEYIDYERIRSKALSVMCDMLINLGYGGGIEFIKNVLGIM